MSTGKIKISFNESKKLFLQNLLTSDHEVLFAEGDRVDAALAIKLGKLNMDVPEQYIFYPADDDLCTEDEDHYFSDDFKPINSDIDHYVKPLQINLNVDPEIEIWMKNADINFDLLFSELLTGFYKSSKVLNS